MLSGIPANARNQYRSLIPATFCAHVSSVTMLPRNRFVLRVAPAVSLFGALATLYLIGSGAPTRVHVLSLACLAIAVLPSTVLLAGEKVSSGVYFCRFTLNDYVGTRKITLLK